jgi:hypothetical protein
MDNPPGQPHRRRGAKQEIEMKNATVTKSFVRQAEKNDYVITFCTDFYGHQVQFAAAATFDRGNAFDPGDLSAAKRIASSLIGERVDGAACHSASTQMYGPVVAEYSNR